MMPRKGTQFILFLLSLAILLGPARLAHAFFKGVFGWFGVAVAVAVVVVAAIAIPAIAPALSAAVTSSLSVVSFASPLAVAAWNVGVSVLGSVLFDQALCQGGVDTLTFTGCGGGGKSGGGGGGSGGGGSGGGSASGVGSTGTCPSGYYVCGSKSCVPVKSVCCANVGITDKYCPSGYTCKADGTCQSGGTPASAPTSSFSASSGGKSASAGGGGAGGGGGVLSVAVGSPIALSWNSTGATSCEINQGVGGVNSSGSVNITCKAPGEFNATLSCAGEGGEISKAITIKCFSTPKIKEIKPE